jgi:hypothetical protein
MRSNRIACNEQKKDQENSIWLNNSTKELAFESLFKDGLIIFAHKKAGGRVIESVSVYIVAIGAFLMQKLLSKLMLWQSASWDNIVIRKMRNGVCLLCEILSATKISGFFSIKLVLPGTQMR